MMKKKLVPNRSGQLNPLKRLVGPNRVGVVTETHLNEATCWLLPEAPKM